MGEAVVAGMLAAKTAAPGDITVADPSAERRDALSSSFGVSVVADAREALAGAATLVLAVKPQIVGDVVADVASSLDVTPPSVVSIAAGVSCGRLEAMFPPGTSVVRVMPNTPAMVGEGMSGVSSGAHATAEDEQAAVEMFSALGKVVVVDEALQDAVTGVSGSGPAYVAVFVEALAGAGVRNGLAPDVASTLALQTLRGTGELLARTGMTPGDLVDAVSSPGGTTFAARGVLEDGRFAEVLGEAVDAAVARSKELGARP